MTAIHSLSFAVGSRFGPRSWKWILTIDGDDLYITPSVMRKKWKVTLHKSGRWHVKMLDGSSSAPLLKAHAKEASPGIKGGLVIVVPDSCLRPASDVDAASPVDRWLERPTYDGFLEIVIGDWQLDRDGPDQPLNDLGFALLCFRTSETKLIFVAHRSVPSDSPAGRTYAEKLAELRLQLPKPVLLDSPERRLAAMFNTEGGAIRIMEIAVD